MLQAVKSLLLFFVTWIFILSPFSEVYGQKNTDKQASIDTISNRLLRLQSNLRQSEIPIDVWLKSMKPDGSWADVDYRDSSRAKWKPIIHLERLKDLAISYGTKGQANYGSEQLKAKILLGLDYFIQQKPSSLNWWYRDIGTPQQIMVVLLFLKGKIDRSKLLYYSTYLKDATGKPSHTGKNRTWVAEITLYKGCVEDNFQLIQNGFQSIASTIYIAKKQGEEGIKTDFSFHQHHEQLYTGGYGLLLAKDYIDYISLVKNSAFEVDFSENQKKLVFDMLLKGHQLLGYQNSLDFGCLGRNIARPNQTANIGISLVDKLSRIDSTHALYYQQWLHHLKGGPFSPSFLGNKFFYQSDIMVQHGPNYYLSARIISKRTVGAESLNGENTKGYYLPLGATNIKTSGNEYQNIFPIWDWTRIPGTTAIQNQKTTLLKGYFFGTNPFGAGLSNGKSGMTAFSATYGGLAFKKAYFFLDGVMICLGAGINSKLNEEVLTSVNQCLSFGKIVTSEGILTNPKMLKNNITWVQHDNVGYQFLGKNTVSIFQKKQSGSWKEINEAESDSVISKNVFSVSINHGKAPKNQSYQYLVAPAYSLTSFKNYINEGRNQIVRNDTLVQAIKNKKLQEFGMVCYAPAIVNFEKGLVVSSDKPALIHIKKLGDIYEIAVADPLYNQTEISIGISKKLTGPNAKNSNGNTLITIRLPGNDFTGSTVINQYTPLP